jgi:hypothetical protein
MYYTKDGSGLVDWSAVPRAQETAQHPVIRPEVEEVLAVCHFDAGDLDNLFRYVYFLEAEICLA